jgi:glycosyltransferase involved in cell wall biosynthesis
VSQSDVLAIFTPQTPVEPVAAPQKYDPTDDDGFKRIMDDASNKIPSTKEGNKSDTDRQDAPSSRSNLEKKPIEKLKHTDNKNISVIMPALNEESDIRDAIFCTLKVFDEEGIDAEIIVMNDGSTDKTHDMVENIMKTEPRVRLKNHSKPWGMGGSFWDGVDHAKGDWVVCLPGDNENDPREIFRYIKLLEHVDIIIPFIFNREVRPLCRNVLSYFYRLIVNVTFGTNLNYTNGTVMYKKTLLKSLSNRSKGYFFQTDILIRLVRQGYLFAEVPQKLDVRMYGESKALSFPSFFEVVKGYLKLIKDLRILSLKKKTHFIKNSASARRA